MFDYQRLPPLSCEGTVKVPNSGTGTATVRRRRLAADCDMCFMAWHAAPSLPLYTVWLFNVAMENDPFIDGLPIKKWWFSMAMLNYQMVHVSKKTVSSRKQHTLNLYNLLN